MHDMKIDTSHDVTEGGGLLRLVLEDALEGVEAEFLCEEELELEAEVHVVVDFLELAVLPEEGGEGGGGQPVPHELLHLHKAQLLLGPLELVLQVPEHLPLPEPALQHLPALLYPAVEEGLLDLGPLLVVQGRLDGHQLDPAFELAALRAQPPHVLGEGLQPAHVLEVPLPGVLAEDHRQDLEVVGEQGLLPDVVPVLAEGDAGLVEDHEELLEAVEVGQEGGAGTDGPQLLHPLLLHLEGQHLAAQLELAPRIQHPLSPPLPLGLLLTVVETHLPLAGGVLEGGVGPPGVLGHFAPPPRPLLPALALLHRQFIMPLHITFIDGLQCVTSIQNVRDAASIKAEATGRTSIGEPGQQGIQGQELLIMQGGFNWSHFRRYRCSIKG